MRRPLVHVALFWIIGQVAASSFAIPETFLWAGLAFVLGSATFLLRKTPKADQLVSSRGVLILVLFALAGALSQQRIDRRDAELQRVYSQYDQRFLIVQGVLDGMPIGRRDGWSVALKSIEICNRSDQTDLPGTLLLYVNSTNKSAKGEAPLPGQIVRASGYLRLPEIPGNPLQFDQAAYMKSRGFAASMFIPDYGMIEGSELPEGPRASERFLRRTLAFKDWSSAQIDRYVGANWTALTRSLLFGDTFLLDDEVKDAVRRTGLAHIMAVSGQHAAFISLLIFFLLRALGVPWRATWILTAIGIWMFAILVGMQPPVIRAAILASAMASAYLLGREPDPLNSLALAALVVLVTDPHSLYKADFQLSYLCVLSIILLQPGVSRWLLVHVDDLPPRRRRLALAYNTFISRPLVMSVASQIALVPVLAHHFHLFPLIGFLANVIMVPLSGLIVVLGFVVIFAGAILPPLGAALGIVCQFLLYLFSMLVEAFASVPWAAMPLAPMPAWAVALFFIILFSGCYLRRSAAPGEMEMARARFLVHVAALVALMVWLPEGQSPSGQLVVRMLDVGQGDAILIQSPAGQNLLIDGGPEFAGQKIIVPFLRAHGIQRLNAVVATHADSDHIGGLADLVRNVPVDLFIMSPEDEKTSGLVELEDAIRARGIPLSPVVAGNSLQGFDGCKISVLNPQDGFGDDNDQSIVLRLDHEKNSFLFCGDISTEAELRMLPLGDLLDCDVFKVAHHGSLSSTSPIFLRAVSPALALFSVGKRNRYGHPHPDILDRVRREGAAILRSDLHGAVSIFSDGQALKVVTARNVKAD